MGWDGVIGLLLLAAGALLWRAAGEIPQSPFLPLGPDFYPRLLLAVLAVLAAALVVADLRAHRRTPGERRTTPPHCPADLPPGAPAPPETPTAWARHRRVLWTYLLFGVYVALMPVLGFRLATWVFVGALTWVLGSRTPSQAAVSLAAGLATALLTHAIFETSLRILLPRGLW
ncbi:MAG: tripartite tricarboxylate transporter TctB family protein [Armatimonadota bacterium]|nr:tripartite tricarboxylate transporter TctB family protein [Armatimonadota bacterium]MDR7519146.1 tripartite tricarboxylate transporter TctB family protein [Armatimonadota bacterium]MDR7549606.1 tripartite tricarboxylate transporter TctB family protein [Armatimonadota bacterium]